MTHDEDALWERIRRHAGHEFQTVRGLPFSYAAPGNHLRITREGREINRSLSRTNFMKAAAAMPSDSPVALRARQGSSYTWAILMDPRIRHGFW